MALRGNEKENFWSTSIIFFRAVFLAIPFFCDVCDCLCCRVCLTATHFQPRRGKIWQSASKCDSLPRPSASVLDMKGSNLQWYGICYVWFDFQNKSSLTHRCHSLAQEYVTEEGDHTYTVSQFRVCILRRSIWRPIMLQGCPNSKAPRNADAPLLSFVASRIPRFFAHLKKKKEREKMPTSRGVDHHFVRNHDVRVKHLVTQPGNAPKSRPSHLITVDVVNKVSPEDSPSKTAKAGSSEECRPWI